MNESILSSSDSCTVLLKEKFPEMTIPSARKFTPSKREFSFNLNFDGVWKSESGVLTWIRGVPTVQRIPPLQTSAVHDEKHPSQFHGEKHTLNMETDGSVASEPQGHPPKRAKVDNAPSKKKFVPQRKRNQLLRSARKVTRSVSIGFDHLLTPLRNLGIKERGHEGSFDGSTFVSTGSVPGTPVNETMPRKKLRFVFVGDEGSGKSSLLMRFYRNTFVESYTQTQFELFNRTVYVDGENFELELWDTSGLFELHQLSRLSYLKWDAIFICFSVNNDLQFANSQDKWAREVRTYGRDAPTFLLGLKKDTRAGYGLWGPMFPILDTRIDATEGSIAAHGIGAMKYMECSAKTGEGVDRIFEEGTRIVHRLQNKQEEAEILKERQVRTKGAIGQLFCF